MLYNILQNVRVKVYQSTDNLNVLQEQLHILLSSLYIMFKLNNTIYN